MKNGITQTDVREAASHSEESEATGGWARPTQALTQLDEQKDGFDTTNRKGRPLVIVKRRSVKRIAEY